MKYRDELGKYSVRARIGPLYLGLRPDRDFVVSYSMVFILRRVVFVMITFALFNYPGIQIQMFIYVSLLYIIYIGHTYFHEPSSSKDLELVNEAIFLFICYHFVTFVISSSLFNLIFLRCFHTNKGLLLFSISVN